MGYIHSFYPQWKTWAWRFIRGAVSSAFAQTVIYTCGAVVASPLDVLSCFNSIRARWSDPKIAAEMIAVSFLSGLLLAIGVALRDWIAGQDKTHIINKLPI